MNVSVLESLLNESPEFYKGYLKTLFSELPVETPSVDDALGYSFEQALDLFSIMYEEQKDYSYAEGKWSIVEVIGHLIDAERIFAVRALRIGRGETTNQAGWDENEFAKQANYQTRSLESVKQEYLATMESSGYLWENLGENKHRKGLANKSPMTPELIGFINAGHRLHHYQIIKERYLSTDYEFPG